MISTTGSGAVASGEFIVTGYGVNNSSVITFTVTAASSNSGTPTNLQNVTVELSVVAKAGTNGSNGSTGAQGAQGAKGSTGLATNGAQGAQGAGGSNGTPGGTGAQGARGANGTNGSNGSQGAQGAPGPKGDAASVSGFSGEINFESMNGPVMMSFVNGLLQAANAG